MKLDSERIGSGGAATTSSQNLHRAQRCEANRLKLPKTCRNDGRLLEKKSWIDSGHPGMLIIYRPVESFN